MTGGNGPERLALCGPAGSGKTRALLDEYTRAVAAWGEDAALFLLPTSLACRRTRLALVEDGHFPALFDPRILTFPQLAELLLRANGQSVAQVSPWQRQLLMRSVTRDLRAQGRLPELAHICGYPGFIDELCDLVEEIKRAAVDPAQFSERIQASRVNDARSRELAVIYERYQGLLQERDVFDEAGRFWRTRDVLASGRRRPFDDLRLILVDGFDDLTTTQVQVLKLLAEGGEVERVVVTVCLEEDEARRPELFGTPARMRSDLRKALGELTVEWSRASGPVGPMVALGENLFAEGGLSPEADPADVVEFIEAPGRRAEVTQIARRVKDLIRDGADPDRIGVMARDLSGYARALTEVFGEAGVPLSIDGQAPVSSRPSVQAALDILRVPTEGYRCADVMRLLKSNFVDLSPLQPDEPIEPDEVERIARDAMVMGGDRDHWRQRLALHMGRIVAELDARGDEEERDDEEQWVQGRTAELELERGRIERAQVLITGLFELLARLPERGGPAEFVTALCEVIAKLGIEESVGRANDPAVSASNIMAFGAMMDGLRQLWAAERQLGLASEMTLDEFAADVIRMAGSVTCRQAGRVESGVLAVAVDDARQLDFDHVFLMGMTEREFPRGQRESALYSDAEREALGRANIPLDPRVDDRRREAFLFYQGATAAHKRLWLSYPTVDAEGHALLRSHYVDEIARCFAGPVFVAQQDISQVVVGFDEVTGCGELLARCMLELYGPRAGGQARDESRARSGLNLLAGTHPELLVALTDAIEVEDRRNSRQAPDEYDGALSADATVAWLAEEFGPERMFSAGQLGDYGDCPFAFFARRVLDLQAMADVTEDIDAMALGTVRHRCLSVFFAKWQETREDRRIEESDLPAAREVMSGLVDWAFRDVAARSLVADQAVFDVMREEVRRDLMLWLDFEVRRVQVPQKGPGHTATVLEAGFGYGRVPPLVIGEGDERVLVRGRIDRVDRFDDDDGAPAFAVYDYKSSEGPSGKRIEEGKDFQLPAYAAAVRDDPGNSSAPRCVDWGYYKVRRPIYMRGKPKPETIEDLIEQMRGWALRHAAAIRAGRFAPDPDTCDYCDYRSLCRWDEWRFEAKRPAGGDGDE